MGPVFISFNVVDSMILGNENLILISLIDYKCPEFNPIEALGISGVIDFQVDGARHLLLVVLTRRSKDSCIVIFLYLPYSCYYVALMVWSNHDENISFYFIFL